MGQAKSRGTFEQRKKEAQSLPEVELLGSFGGLNKAGLMDMGLAAMEKTADGLAADKFGIKYSELTVTQKIELIDYASGIGESEYMDCWVLTQMTEGDEVLAEALQSKAKNSSAP